MYYKVVTKDLFSCCIGGKYRVQYKLGEFVYPTKQGSYLFVFDNLTSAMKFAQDTAILLRYYGETLCIYSCETEGVEANPNQSQLSYTPPTGTVFAYGVKLLELCKTVKPISQSPVLKYGDIVYVNHGHGHIITPLGLIRSITYNSYYDHVDWSGRTLEDLRTTYPDLEWGLNDE